MVETNVRGSTYMEALSAEDLQKSIGAARGAYKIERWWKFGQPRIDLIEATLNVTNPKQIGPVVAGLLAQHGSRSQVSCEVFPYGIPSVEGMRINLKINPVVH